MSILIEGFLLLVMIFHTVRFFLKPVIDFSFEFTFVAYSPKVIVVPKIMVVTIFIFYFLKQK